MLLLQHEAGGQNWSTSFEDISEKNGLGIIWLCQGVGFEARFIADFKDRFFSCYKQNWHSEIESDDRYG